MNSWGRFSWAIFISLFSCSGESTPIFITDLGNPVIFDKDLEFSDEKKEDTLLRLNAAEDAYVNTIHTITSTPIKELRLLLRYEPLVRRYTIDDHDFLEAQDNGVLLPWSSECIMERSDMGALAVYFHKYLYGRMDPLFRNAEYWIPVLQLGCDLKEPLCGIPCDTDYSEVPWLNIGNVPVPPLPPIPDPEPDAKQHDKGKHKGHDKHCD